MMVLGPLEAAGQEADVPPALAAQDEEWLKHRIDLLDEVTFTQGADSLFNPGGTVLPIETWRNALRLNGEFAARLPAGFSAKAQVSSALSTGSETETALQAFALREMYTTASLGDFELSVGRKLLKWTNGYAFNPAGLLEPQRSPSDPQDRLRLLEGLDVAQLDYFVGDHVFTAVFSSDVLTNSEEDTRRYDLALRANVLVTEWNLDVAAMAMVSNVKHRGAVTFNYVLGEALELHGEISGSQGTIAEYPRSILPDNQRTLFGRNYLDTLKVDETRLFLRYVVGFNYTLPWGTNLIGEFYHTDEGLSQEEWGLFLQQVRYAGAHHATGQYPAVIDGRSLPQVNLLLGLRWLASQDVRQNYLFLRAAHSWMAERLNGQVLALVSLEDRSGAFVGEVSYLAYKGATVYARATLLAGNDSSEFGNVSQRGSLITGLLFSF
jgi:hypothetical protein